MTTPNDSPQFKNMDDAWEYIQGQEPLPNVAANTDFNQGVERGKYIERTRIIKMLEAEIQRLEDQGAAQGPGWMRAGISNCEHTIKLIKGENK